MGKEFLDGFRESYSEARAAFLSAAASVGTVQSFRNPARGPDDEELATDIAWCGPRDATQVLVLMSGTHGVEGLSGSACQVNWLSSGQARKLPPGVAVLLIHLINPYGVAWQQRWTEDLIDLNRNFVDHDRPYGETPLYDRLHTAFMCPDRSGPARAAADAAIAAFRAEHGERVYAQTVFGGQHSHPDGLNFSGTSAGWSNRTFRSIAGLFLQASRRVLFLDYHTGLGPFGEASLVVFRDPGDDLSRQAITCMGPSIMAVGGSEVTGVAGHTGQGLAAALPQTDLLPITVEFGTFDIDTECRVVVDDLWLHHYGDRHSPEGRRIKRDLVEYFHPASAAWRERVAARSEELIAQGLAWLSRESVDGH